MKSSKIAEQARAIGPRYDHGGGMKLAANMSTVATTIQTRFFRFGSKKGLDLDAGSISDTDDDKGRRLPNS